jgi:hypothetical protein
LEGFSKKKIAAARARFDNGLVENPELRGNAMLTFLYPAVNQLAMVTSIKTAYATGLLKLVKSAIAFTPNLDVATLTAIEADFSGYAAKTLTTLPPAYYDVVNGGVSFTIPTQQWTRTLGTPDVPNDIFGGWIENAGGDLLMAWGITTSWGMQAVGDALPLEITLNFFGTNELYLSIGGVPQ